MSRPSRYIKLFADGIEYRLQGNFFSEVFIVSGLSDDDLKSLSFWLKRIDEEIIRPYEMVITQPPKFGDGVYMFAVRGKLLCLTLVVCNTRMYFPVPSDCFMYNDLLNLF